MRRLKAHQRLELSDGLLTLAENLKDPDPSRMPEGSEELRFALEDRTTGHLTMLSGRHATPVDYLLRSRILLSVAFRTSRSQKRSVSHLLSE